MYIYDHHQFITDWTVYCLFFNVSNIDLTLSSVMSIILWDLSKSSRSIHLSERTCVGLSIWIIAIGSALWLLTMHCQQGQSWAFIGSWYITAAWHEGSKGMQVSTQLSSSGILDVFTLHVCLILSWKNLLDSFKLTIRPLPQPPDNSPRAPISLTSARKHTIY